MKKSLSIGVLAAVTMTGVSIAADMPGGAPYRPTPFIPQQAVEWTGLYFGINAGYGWGQHTSNIRFAGNNGGFTNPVFSGFNLVGGPTELSQTTVSGSGGLSGGLAGGQIGFNWQAGMFVFGAEIDGQWSGQESTFTLGCGADCTATQNVKLRSLMTGRGRFGLAFDWIMPYVTGGAALVNGLDNLSMTVGGVAANFLPLSGSTLGWTAGAGVEVALWSNWSAKFEYLYVSANGLNVTALIPNALGQGTATTPMEYRDNIVRVGLNYRFGPRGGPGVLEPPLLARETYAWSGDLLPNLRFATGSASAHVAASNRTKTQPIAQAKSAVTEAMQGAPIARQAAPRQVVSATNEPLPTMADDDVISTDAIAPEPTRAKPVMLKRQGKEEDESARIKRIMAICSGC
jgi:outer membrane immunogenic protein